MEIYLLRHAHAGDPYDWRGDDALRPLSEKGRAQAERLGAFLAARSFRPDGIVSSPKTRALETAHLVGEALGIAPSVDARLGTAFDLDAADEVLRAIAGERVVLVGHDPDFSELVAGLVGAPRVPMRKGALARVDASLPLRQGRGTLRWLLPPDALAVED